MKTSASTLGLALLGSSLLLGFSGCTVEVKSDQEFLGTEATQTATYTAGKDIIVSGVNGSIRVVPGTTGSVSVTFSPFSIRASDEKDQAISEMQKNLTMSATTDANGNVVVTTGRSGGSTGLGAKMVVAIPPELSAKLSITQGNGDVHVETAAAAAQLMVDDNGAGGVTAACGSAFAGEIRIQNQAGDVTVGSVGAATLVDIENTGTGDCVLKGSPTITNSVVYCGWNISVSSVSDHVDILSTNTLGDATVAVSIAGISDTTSGGSVTLTSGQVNLTMPATETYALTAQAYGGQVNLGTPPTTCNVTAASPGSKSMACTSTTPVYTVVAGDATGNVGNITVGYQ